MQDNWQVAYQTETGLYETLSRSEDDGNRVLQRLESFYDFSHKDVLEIGCGSGRYTPFLARKSRSYWALDLSAPMLALARAKCRALPQVTWLHCSAEQIPLPAAAVDVVFASWVLTAMPTHEMRVAVDREIRRVLRPAGHVWLFENAGSDEFIEDLWGRETYTAGDPLVFVIQKLGYEPVETVETAFVFPDVETARRVFGFVLGEHAVASLEQNPRSRIGHKVLILHRQNLSTDRS